MTEMQIDILEWSPYGQLCLAWATSLFSLCGLFVLFQKQNSNLFFYDS